MNWSTFRTRSLTALAFVVIMLTGLLWNEWSFFVLFSLIHAGCWVEYNQLNRRMLPGYSFIHPLFTFGLATGGWALCWILYRSVHESNNFFTVGIILAIAAVLILSGGFFLSRKAGAKSLIRAVLGLFYISLSFALLMHLRSGALWIPESMGHELIFLELLAKNIGYWVPILLIGSIWINDTMAYIVGSFFGKTPLSSISPKKTWEGTVGGIFLAVIIAYIVGRIVLGARLALDFMAVAYIAAVAGTLGDLLESKLKRMAGVKDSGTIMPGHGGFLDRFDSLLIATPFVWAYLWLVS